MIRFFQPTTSPGRYFTSPYFRGQITTLPPSDHQTHDRSSRQLELSPLLHLYRHRCISGPLIRNSFLRTTSSSAVAALQPTNIASMPSYGSLHSPSLRKMENSRVQYGSSRKRVSLGNIIGDPFALATISISAVCFYSCVLKRMRQTVCGGVSTVLTVCN